MAKMVIKRFGVLSAAKLYAVVMAAIGLIIGVPVGLIMMVVGAAVMSMGRDGGAPGGVGIGMGLVYMIVLPIFYGLIGFIFGALGALVYNMAAGFLGGLELELENADAGYAAPPQPQDWSSQQQYQPGQQQHPY